MPGKRGGGDLPVPRGRELQARPATRHDGSDRGCAAPSKPKAPGTTYTAFQPR